MRKEAQLATHAELDIAWRHLIWAFDVLMRLSEGCQRYSLVTFSAIYQP